MINEEIITKFLNTPTDNWDFLKDETEEALTNSFKELGINFTFKTKPRIYQLVSFIIGVSQNSFLFFLSMGAGKCKISLDILSYRFQNKQIKRALVLVPYAVLLDTWEEQAEIHSNLFVLPLYGSTIEKWQKLNLLNKEQIIIITYSGLLSMLKHSVTHRKQTKEIWDEVKFERFIEKFDTIIMDESNEIKNHQALQSKLVINIASKMKCIYGLTGTPFSKNPHDVWTQFYTVDKGYSLGKNLTLFRDTFFDTEVNKWGGYEYKLRHEMTDELYKRMKHKSIRYRKEELTTLPPLVKNIITLHFDKEQKKAYYDTLTGLCNEKEFKKRESSFYKLRGVCSGYISNRIDIGEGEIEKVFDEFKFNPKLDWLLSLITGVDEDDKIVVFYAYTQTGDIICNELDKLKLNYSRLYGETKDKVKAIKKFTDNENCKILVVNNASGALGLNLQCANYVVYFETDVSPIVREQSESRCHRQGQVKTVFMYDLVMKNSIEEKILESLKEGKNFVDLLLDRDSLKKIIGDKENE